MDDQEAGSSTEPQAQKQPKPICEMPQEIQDFFFKVVLPWQKENLPVRCIQADPVSWLTFTRGYVEGRLGTDIGLDLSKMEVEDEDEPVIYEMEKQICPLDLSNDESTISNSSLVTFAYSSDENNETDC